MTNTTISSRIPRARLITGAVIAAAVVAGAVAVALAPWPGVTRTPAVITAAPPAAASLATCDGPILGAGRDSAAASTLTDAASLALVSAASDGSVPSAASLTAVDVTGGVGPTAFSAEPVDGVRTDVAGAGSAQLSDADLRGFAASACTRAAMQSWLVGGSGATGAADLVVIANPGDVAARVEITVYGAEGATTPAAGAGLTIAARSQRIIPLAALALGEASPVLQVDASEAPVRASLQTSITRVLVPGGVDQVGTTAVPDTTLTLPGVVVAQPPGDAGASDVPAILRMLAPGGAARATVEIWGPSGPVGDAQTVDLTADVPLELDLTGLPVGTYTVRVDADAPLTAAAWSATGFGEGADFAWFTAADELTAPGLVAIAAGPTPTVTLAASAAADQIVQVVADAGAGLAREVTVPAGRSVSVDVDPGAVYRIEPSAEGLHAAVAYAGAGQIAGYPVQTGEVAAASVDVYPR